MKKETIEALYPLSDAQAALLFHYSLSPANDPGFLQVQFALKGPLDRATMEQAWLAVFARHEALRTSVQTAKNGKSMLVVSKQCEPAWSFQDLRAQSDDEQATRLASFLEEDQRKGLDLAHPPVTRLTIMQTGATSYHFAWSCHRLLLDGWSCTAILQEVMDAYERIRTQQPLVWPKMATYGEYLAWKKSQSSDDAITFWKAYLKNFQHPTSLSALASAEGDDSRHETAFIQHLLPSQPDTNKIVDQTSAYFQVTPAAILYAAWGLLISVISGKQDVVFGVTNSGRMFDLPGREKMCGSFSDTALRRCDVNPTQSLQDFIKVMHRDQFRALPFEHLSYFEVEQNSEVRGTLPLSNSLVVFQNTPWKYAGNEQAGGLSMSHLISGITTTFPLTLVITADDPWIFRFIYSAKLDPDKVIATMTSFPSILQEIGRNPDQPMATLVAWLKEQLLPLLDPVPADEPTAHNTTETVIQTARNPTELEVAKIWEELLNISPIDVHADFLALGGRSIIAVQLLVLLEERLNTKLTFLEFIEEPTISAIAKRISQGPALPTWRALIPIQPQGNRPPLFCVNAGGEHVLFLRALSQHLGVNQPLFGLQSVGLDDECPPMTSFAEIAALNVKEIREAQPHGPYHLVGHCLGSRVGLEMVHLLRSQGETIGLYLVLDTSPPALSPKTPKPSRLKVGVSNHTKNLASGKWIRALIGLKRYTERRMRFLAKDLGRKKIRRFGSPMEKRALTKTIVQETCEKIETTYVAQPYHGKIHFIRASDHLSEDIDWRDIAAEIETTNLPIRHRHMFLEPDVQHVARTIAEIMERITQPNRVNSLNNELEESSVS